ncbi:MAG: DUF4349 domain-containing protein, partial [bacterium]
LVIIVMAGCGDSSVNRGQQYESKQATVQSGEDAQSDRSESSSSSKSSTLKVSEARLRVETDKINQKYKKVTDLTRSFGGYVESANKSENQDRVRREATLRVPSSRFDTFIRRLQSKLDIDSLQLKNYRISIQSSKDEIDVLNETLSNMEHLRDRVNRMEPGEDTIELLMKLNDRKMQLVKELKRYQRKLSKSRKKSRFATIHVTMISHQPVYVLSWPEEEYRQVLKEYRKVINTFWDIIMRTPAKIALVVLRLVQGLVYIFVVLSVLLGFGILLTKLFSWIPEEYTRWGND